MENLWPDDLLESKSKHTPDEIENSLLAQAEGIYERTGGLLTGHVTNRSAVMNSAWALEIYPTNQPAKKAELFVVRSADGKFPVVIENYDPRKERFKRVEGLSAFRIALKEIFLAQQTKRIVKLLAHEATNMGLQEKRMLTDQPRKNIYEQANQSARPIYMGKVIQTEKRSFSHVSIFSISGFVDAADIQRLLMRPDEKGSPIETLNDNYVVTIKFLDAFKMSLTKNELLVLQTEARKALGQIDGI